MKKFIIFFSVWIGLITILYILHSDLLSKENHKTEIADKINTLYEKFDNRLIKAFYSIEELRPFSIVQIDKIIDLYNKNETWLSPQTLSDKLNKKEKSLLIKRVIEYIDSFSPESRKTETISKLFNWCKADAQFDFLINIMDINQTDIFNLIHKINIEKGFDTKYSDIKSIPLTKINDEQKRFIYYQTINLLSSMKLDLQFNYYSKLYANISDICVK